MITIGITSTMNDDDWGEGGSRDRSEHSDTSAEEEEAKAAPGIEEKEAIRETQRTDPEALVTTRPAATERASPTWDMPVLVSSRAENRRAGDRGGNARARGGVRSRREVGHLHPSCNRLNE